MNSREATAFVENNLSHNDCTQYAKRHSIVLVVLTLGLPFTHSVGRVHLSLEGQCVGDETWCSGHASDETDSLASSPGMRSKFNTNSPASGRKVITCHLTSDDSGVFRLPDAPYEWN